MPKTPPPKQPLAEVFGYKIDDQSDEAKRHREQKLCPFNNRVDKCTKVNADDPLGVCSLYVADDKPPAIVCPVRFREGQKGRWDISVETSRFFFPPNARWQQLGETKLKDNEGGVVGNIDAVLVALDAAGKVKDFGAMEIQSVYTSGGGLRDCFNEYMKDPSKGAEFEWSKRIRVDNPSSGRKRLMPQIISKGIILIEAWDKKIAIIIHEDVYPQARDFTSVKEAEADVVWLLYGLSYNQEENRYRLNLKGTVYTTFNHMVEKYGASQAGDVKEFIEQLQKKKDDAEDK